jgi:hypothetical protein
MAKVKRNNGSLDGNSSTVSKAKRNIAHKIKIWHTASGIKARMPEGDSKPGYSESLQTVMGEKGIPANKIPRKIGNPAIHRRWERYPMYMRRIPPPSISMPPAARKTLSVCGYTIAESTAKLGRMRKKMFRRPNAEAEKHHCHPAARRSTDNGMINQENPHPDPESGGCDGQIFDKRQRAAAGETIRRRISVPVEVVWMREKVNCMGAMSSRRRIPARNRFGEKLNGDALHRMLQSNGDPEEPINKENNTRIFPSMLMASTPIEWESEEEIPVSPISTGLSRNKMDRKKRKSINDQMTITAKGLEAKQATIPEMVNM